MKWLEFSGLGGIADRLQTFDHLQVDHYVPLALAQNDGFTRRAAAPTLGCMRMDHSSYAAPPAPIGSMVLVRLFERCIEIRDLRTQALLRTHTRVDRPGAVVLPMAKRVFTRLMGGVTSSTTAPTSSIAQA